MSQRGEQLKNGSSPLQLEFSVTKQKASFKIVHPPTVGRPLLTFLDARVGFDYIKNKI